jgi:hypothetical protein
VPDRRAHRGPHPEDASLFALAAWPALRQATADLSWLLTRGYARESSLALVGNRYALAARQRIAVSRAACAEAEAADRHARLRSPETIGAAPLWLDGYNVLTSIEAALAGGVILACRDGTYRDMASMHGSYRRVSETMPALELLGRVLAALRPAECVWLLDRPVSNSGRLQAMMGDLAARHGWPWRIQLVDDPDRALVDLPATAIVATADSAILDGCQTWLNLARLTIDREVRGAQIVPLCSGAPRLLD